jgi:polyhydroxyalkanoic acid synthase PhaR subunit
MSQSEHEREQDAPTPDPLNVWGAIYGANMEMWSRTVADMINTDVVAAALGAYLDNYLTTSEPFRRVPEQYMEFWLNSMNMPSRDDVGRLTERVMTLEDRLQMIDTGATPAEQIAPQLDLLTNKLEQRHSAMHTRVEEVQARVEALDGRIGQIIQMIEGQASHVEGLGQQLTQLTEKVETPPPAPTTEVLDERIGQIIQMIEGQAERTEGLEQRLAQLVEQAATPPPAEPSGLDDVQQRLQALESRLDQVIQLVQERASQPAASAQPAEPAELEARVNALDEKAGHMLGLIQALHSAS